MWHGKSCWSLSVNRTWRSLILVKLDGTKRRVSFIFYCPRGTWTSLYCGWVGVRALATKQFTRLLWYCLPRLVDYGWPFLSHAIMAKGRAALAVSTWDDLLWNRKNGIEETDSAAAAVATGDNGIRFHLLLLCRTSRRRRRPRAAGITSIRASHRRAKVFFSL